MNVTPHSSAYRCATATPTARAIRAVHPGSIRPRCAAPEHRASRARVPVSGCQRPSPLHYLQGRWHITGAGSGTLTGTYGLNDGWLRLVPEVQLEDDFAKVFSQGSNCADPKSYTRALYLAWSATEKCFVRLGPAMDASYVITRCPGWDGPRLVWEGVAYNDHATAQKAVRTIYEDLGDDTMTIVEQVAGAEGFDTVATFALQRESPARALDYFDGIWQVQGYSEDAARKRCLFDARLESEPRSDGVLLKIRGTLGDQAYAGDFEQGYDAERGLYYNRAAQSSSASATGWSRGWEGDHFNWDLTLTDTVRNTERKLHIERRRLDRDRFEITERVNDGNGWRTFGQKTATRIAHD